MTFAAEHPDRLIFAARHVAAGAFALLVGGICLVQSATRFEPSGLIQTPQQLAVVGLLAIALGLHWLTSRHEAVVDTGAREVIVRRRFFGCAVALERVPFDGITAVALVRTEEDPPRWGLALDTAAIFPLDPRRRTTWGNTAWPFVRCRIDGNPIWFLDVDDDRDAIARAAAKVAARIGVPVVES